MQLPTSSLPLGAQEGGQLVAQVVGASRCIVSASLRPLNGSPELVPRVAAHHQVLPRRCHGDMLDSSLSALPELADIGFVIESGW